jgi:hypothetical protein
MTDNTHDDATRPIPTAERLLADFAALSDADRDKVREGVGRLCLWCLRPSTRLCDGPVFVETRSGRLRPRSRMHEPTDDATCSADLCSDCARSIDFVLRMHGPRGSELHENSSDRCPYCADVQSRRTEAHRSPRTRVDYSVVNEAMGLVSQTRHNELVRAHAAARRGGR